MPLKSGDKLGPYEILEQIGAGGMGEVYRATDSRLDRTVAIKVLPPDLSQDSERRQRMEREAKLISKLSHPNICALYDVGRQGEMDFLVMEYLEGETLSDRLAKGPLSPEEVLRYGAEIADALDKAHRQGVIHRDLKPGNVVITGTGAKLLDFGLAAMRAPGGNSNSGSETSLPTMTAPLTTAGTVLGTFQYMAPEQLEGEDADARSDIFSLGALLYEMATGARAFEGKSQASLIAAILSSEPKPLSATQPMAPPALDRVVRTCLAKDPEKRWQTAHDVALQLRWIAEGGSEAGLPAPVAARRRSRERLAWMAAGALALVAVVFAAGFFMRTPVRPEPVRFQIQAPPGVTSMGSPRISPDGRLIAFDATDSAGTSSLWLRPLNALAAYPLAGTEDSGRPFWSPDSRYVAFFAGGKLKKVPASGGPAQTITDAATGADGTWGTGGVILFDGGPGDSLWRVSAAGGEVSAASVIDRANGEVEHGWPVFLPDGKHFLFLANKQSGTESALKVGTLGSFETTELGPGDSRLEYSRAGYLVYSQENSLIAQPFDAGRRAFSGERRPISDQVGSFGSGLAHLSVSDNGTLIYRGGASTTRNRAVWVDRTGRRQAAVGAPGDIDDPELSQDERFVALRIRDERADQTDVWIIELERNLPTRFTFHASPDVLPIWSPDGHRMVFVSTRDGNPDLYMKATNGLTEAEPFLKSPAPEIATDWSPDGREIVLQAFRGATRFDILVAPVDGGEPRVIVGTPFMETHGQLSPDGRWLAYASNESGTAEVYVVGYPEPGGKRQVSTRGGYEPRWRGDGRELFYLSADSRVMSVDVTAGETFNVGAPRELFTEAFRPPSPAGWRYDVTADGQRFLLILADDMQRIMPTTVVLNWTAGLDDTR